MKKKTVFWIVVTGILLAGMAAGIAAPYLVSKEQGKLLTQGGLSVETALTDGIRSKEDILTFTTTINMLMGRRNVGNIRIGDNRLMVHPSRPNESAVDKNIQFLQSLYPAARARYLILVPDSTQLYANASVFETNYFSAKSEEQKILQKLGSAVTGVEGVSTLSAVKNEYICYRTERGLTYRGGYYLYKAFAAKAGFASDTLDSYSVKFLNTDYFGTLSKQVHYYDIQPDVVALAVPDLPSLQTIRYDNLGEESFSRGLYSERAGGAVFGLADGAAAMEIITGVPTEETLFMVADEYGWQMLPYLAGHYANIVVVRPDCKDFIYKKAVGEKQFSQVITVVGIDSFVGGELFKTLQ